jgi:hypothetical protein
MHFRGVCVCGNSNHVSLHELSLTQELGSSAARKPVGRIHQRYVRVANVHATAVAVQLWDLNPLGMRHSLGVSVGTLVLCGEVPAAQAQA